MAGDVVGQKKVGGAGGITPFRRAQLKARVKEAERAGDMAEALRLAVELQRLERPREAVG